MHCSFLYCRFSISQFQQGGNTIPTLCSAQASTLPLLLQSLITQVGFIWCKKNRWQIKYAVPSFWNTRHWSWELEKAKMYLLQSNRKLSYWETKPTHVITSNKHNIRHWRGEYTHSEKHYIIQANSGWVCITHSPVSAVAILPLCWKQTRWADIY